MRIYTEFEDVRYSLFVFTFSSIDTKTTKIFSEPLIYQTSRLIN